jgi:hypothetical protein
MVWVSFWIAASEGVPTATSVSGAELTKSAANAEDRRES